MREHTFAIHLRMAPKAILHCLEFLYAVDALRLFFRVDEARESVTEFLTARSMGHPTEARTIPIDFTRLRVVSASSSSSTSFFSV